MVSECCGGRIKATLARTLVCVGDVVVLGGDVRWRVVRVSEASEGEGGIEGETGTEIAVVSERGRGESQGWSSNRREWVECRLVV